METCNPFLGDNSHLTLDDFKRIFNDMSAKYMWQIWNQSGRIEGVFRFHLCTNDVLAWDRAKAGQVEGIIINTSLNYN